MLAIFDPPKKKIHNRNDTTTYIRITIKFAFSEKATKVDKIFDVNLTVCSNRQIDGEDFVNFCGLLRKHEL